MDVATRKKSDLPSFDNHAHPRAHENHPARIFVVVNKVEEYNELDKDIGDDLEQMQIRNGSWRTILNGHTVLHGVTDAERRKL